MDRETARQYIREHWRDYAKANLAPAAQKVNGEESFVCPFCGHGSNGDGLTFNPQSKDRNGLKCFGCGWAGDVFDLYAAQNGTDFKTTLTELSSQMGLILEAYRPSAAEDFRETSQRAPQAPQNDETHEAGVNTPATSDAAQSAPTAAPVDFTEYYKLCAQRLHDPRAEAYLTGRGISLETAQAYFVGFDPAADPANAPGAMGNEYRPHPAPRIITPTSRSHFVGRAIDPDTPKAYQKMNNKDGRPGLFNLRSLFNGAAAVFVTEGFFDALSFLEIGAPAIALNSTSNAERLLSELQTQRTDAALILCLDNDKAGQEATQRLRDGLSKLNIAYTVAGPAICGDYKDPNERLQKDREGFIKAAVDAAGSAGARKPDNTALYIDTLMSADIERFKDEKRTGFTNLDEAAGGLYGGLYILAAPSSLGKTTFALQLADQLAEHGHDSIFFSLEQSRLELVSKSIARKTAQNDPAKAVTSLAIRKGYLPAHVLQAAQDYKTAVGDRVSIIEGNFNCTISFIGDYIRQYTDRNRTRPVVFIDYLQLLQPAEDSKRQTTKEIVDSTVTTLKRLSRELDLTVIAISSVNRMNYLAPFDFESLKESGSIEFTADVVWGLQYAAVHDQIFDKDGGVKGKREAMAAAKAANPRRIELVCKKNRYGRDYSCCFDYYPANDLYKELSGGQVDFAPTQPKAGRKL